MDEQQDIILQENEVLKLEVDALEKKSSVLERSFDALKIKNDYLSKEVELLNTENIELKSQNELLKKENETFTITNQELKASLQIEKQKLVNLELQIGYNRKQDLTRTFIAEKLNLKSDTTSGHRVKNRIYWIAETLLVNGDIPFKTIRSRYGISKATVARNLKILRKAHIIKIKRVNKEAILSLSGMGYNLKNELNKLRNS
jgi:hypothetical protein